jgi:uncharacterized SAM-binding protein YcdF (DUF218 family)
MRREPSNPRFHRVDRSTFRQKTYAQVRKFVSCWRNGRHTSVSRDTLNGFATTGTFHWASSASFFWEVTWRHIAVVGIIPLTYAPMFWLKKFVSFWLMPLPLCLTLLVLGVLLLHSSRRPNRGRALITLATLLLLLFSNKAVSTWLIRPLESVYPAIPEFVSGEPLPSPLATCRYIVVLGGGHGDTLGLSAANKLSTSSRGRLMEGLRLLRALPETKLITTGGGEPGRPSHAEVLAQAAIALGFDSARITRLEMPRDTEEEAQEVKRVVGDQPFALVTSAWHMKRAAALMRHAGLHPVPCPADYTVRPSEVFRATDLSWDSDSLGRSTWAIYERIGYAWSWLRDKV